MSAEMKTFKRFTLLLVCLISRGFGNKSLFGKVFLHDEAFIFESLEEWKFKIVPTLILIGANVLMYVYTSLLSGNFVTTDVNVLTYYGQYNALVFRGFYLQLFTAMFVHVNIVHLASNMLFLFIFGLRAEELFSTTEYYLIYFASGLAGNTLSLAAGPDLLSAGASGAIFGVFGANIIFLRKATGQPVIVSLMYAFIFLVLTMSINTNIYAHLGGLVVGLALGYFFAGRKKLVRMRVRYRV
jgi:rhomboid protease GluP